MSASTSGGIRLPNYQYELAIGRLEDLMVQAVPWTRIVAILSEEGYTESAATAAAWRREVMARWAAEDSETRPARRDLWRQRLERLYQDLLERARMMDPGHVQVMMFGEAAKVAKLAVAVEGIASMTHRHEHTGKVPASAMAPIDRERELNALLGKREQIRAKGGN